jgi:hypothetical protein
MGEARRRKLSDPSFGNPKRGIVVSPPIEIEGSSLFAKSSNLDPQQLAIWTLFFDKIVWPSSRAIHFSSGPNELFLEECGVLTRPDYTVWGDGAQGIAHGQIKAFRELDAKEPGCWSLAQGENSLLLKDYSLEPNQGLMLELVNAIPVPDKTVPLNEVLEFKLKRYDELEFLRKELDKFVSQIAKSEDKTAEFEKCIKQLDIACADAIRVSREWQQPIRLTSLKASFSISTDKLVVNGLVANAVLSSGMPILAAALVSAALAVVPVFKIGSDFGWRGLKRELGPYRYVYQINNELR